MLAISHLLFFASPIYAFVATQVCQQRYIRRLSGYRCEERPDEVQIHDIQPQRCNYECMRRTNCNAASYNTLENTCLVNEANCAGVELKPAFEVTYFGNSMTTTTCLSWVPQSEFDSARAVNATSCYMDGAIVYHCHVGRLVDGEDVLPAVFVPALNAQFSVFNGDRHTRGEGQVLQVQPECEEIWAIFDPKTDPLPPGAVKAGYLTGTGSDLYLVKAIPNPGKRLFGYFNPETSFVYYFYSDTAYENRRRVGILVLL